MWTPKRGTQDLLERFGEDDAFVKLTRLLSGEVAPSDFAGPYREVLLCIGDGHARALLHDPAGERLEAWPRVWAARALAYLGDDAAADWLLAALRDPHWRVRMTAAQTLGRLQVEGVEDALARALEDEHDRVRATAATALGRIGNEFALEPLQGALDDVSNIVRKRADRALARVEKRVAEER